jgi:hypothetical protein
MGCDRFDSSKIQFMAVLGIFEDENCLRNGDKYSCILARLIYCVRVLFVKYTIPAATRAEQTIENTDRFLELRKEYFVVKSYSSCNFLIKVLGYGFEVWSVCQDYEHAEDQPAQNYSGSV